MNSSDRSSDYAAAVESIANPAGYPEIQQLSENVILTSLPKLLRQWQPQKTSKGSGD